MIIIQHQTQSKWLHANDLIGILDYSVAGIPFKSIGVQILTHSLVPRSCNNRHDKGVEPTALVIVLVQILLPEGKHPSCYPSINSRPTMGNGSEFLSPVSWTVWLLKEAKIGAFRSLKSWVSVVHTNQIDYYLMV